jgi:hypothetical protein
MSRTQRFGLLASAVAIAVAAFLILGTGDDEEEATLTPGPPAAGTARETATAPSALEPPPVVEKVRLQDLAPVGGVKEIEAAKGDTIRFVVVSDGADQIHLHGYDITLDAGPGKPARFRVKADIEGIFEIESHEAEQAGKDPLVAKLRVEP